MGSVASRYENAPHPGVEELRSIGILADLPEEGLSWLASHMGVVDSSVGEIVLRAGEPAEHMFVILSGELRAERGDGSVYVAHAGQVTGMLPFSRLTHYLSDVRAITPLRVAALPKQSIHRHDRAFSDAAEKGWSTFSQTGFGKRR